MSGIKPDPHFRYVALPWVGLYARHAVVVANAGVRRRRTRLREASPREKFTGVELCRRHDPVDAVLVRSGSSDVGHKARPTFPIRCFAVGRALCPSCSGCGERRGAGSQHTFVQASRRDKFTCVERHRRHDPVDAVLVRSGSSDVGHKARPTFPIRCFAVGRALCPTVSSLRRGRKSSHAHLTAVRIITVAVAHADRISKSHFEDAVFRCRIRVDLSGHAAG